MSVENYMNRPLNPNRIPFIHNYCDRWCKRCTMTAYCAVYDMEQEKGKTPPLEKDKSNEEFWKRMLEPLLAAHEMVRQMCIEKGINPDDIDFEEDERERAVIKDKAQSLPCVMLAEKYFREVGEWHKKSRDMFEEKQRELTSLAIQDLPGLDVEKEAAEIKDAYEVIMWFQHFIYIKTMRAVDGKLCGVPEAIADLPKDYDGSAKIALVAIEKSKAAWVKFLGHFPEQEDEILALLANLEKNETALEQYFPDARAFVRPGFD